MNENKEITLEDVLGLLDKSYELVYVDYRSSLDDSLEAVAEAIRKQDWCPIDEEIDDWVLDSQDYGLDYALKELAENLQREFDLERDEVEDILKEYEEEIREEIYARDNSDVIKDLLRNTGDPVMFYDTGEEIYDGCMCDEKEGKEILKTIKKALKIKLSDKTWDDDLNLLISQGDSGRLVIYFTADIKQMMTLSEFNLVTFSHPNIAIINTWNGSGDNCQLVGHEFTIPFTIENFFMDKEVKYSYTYEVCGMSSNWCEGTGVHFSNKKTTKKPNSPSSLHHDQEAERRMKKTFEAGGCTFGDMDIRRHRNTYYLNEFPCGTHCPHCHTFWID